MQRIFLFFSFCLSFVAAVYGDSILFDNDSLSFYHIQTGVGVDSLDTFYLSGTTDIEDTWIYSLDPTVNYGSDVDLIIGDVASTERTVIIGAPYLADSVAAYSAGWEIKEVRLDLYVSSWPDLGNVLANAYYMVKPFTLEDEVTYNRWSAHLANYFEWGSSGANNTGSTWNEADGSGDDRGGTSQGNVTISSTGWKYITLDTAWINNVIDLDSTLKYVILDLGTAYSTIHSSEYTTDTTLTPRFRFIMEKAGSPVGTDNDYGSDTLVNLGKDTDDGQNWTAHGILGFWGLNNLMSGRRIDSVVCSLFVSDFDTDGYFQIYRADSTKSNAESKSFGSAADGAETTWPLYQVDGGGVTGDSTWTDSGGDYYATPLDSFHFTGAGWNVQTFSSWTYVLGGGDSATWPGEACEEDPTYNQVYDLLFNMPEDASQVRKMIVSLTARGVNTGVSPVYLRFYVSNDTIYDSTNLDRAVGGDRLTGLCGLGRPHLTVWTQDVDDCTPKCTGYSRRFIFDFDRIGDEFRGPTDSGTNDDWSMYLNTIGPKSFMIDITDADNDPSDDGIVVDTVFYTIPNGIVDYFQAIADGSSVVDHELRGSEEFFSQVGNLFIVNDNDDFEVQIASDDNATNPPKFWIYSNDIPEAVSWRYGTLTQSGYFYNISEDSSGINIPLSGGPSDE